MSEVSALFVRESRALMRANHSKIEQSLVRLADEDVWWRPNPASNSAGNLVLHLCGNVTQWMIGGVGGGSMARDRPAEFDARGPMPKRDLLDRLAGVVSKADAVLERVAPADLLSRRQIQGYDVTVFEAIFRVVEHFGMHTGQIILIAKARTGADLGLWQPPTAGTRTTP